MSKAKPHTSPPILVEMYGLYMNGLGMAGGILCSTPAEVRKEAAKRFKKPWSHIKAAGDRVVPVYAPK